MVRPPSHTHTHNNAPHAQSTNTNPPPPPSTDFLSGEDRFASLHLNARQRQIRAQGLRELEAAYEREHYFRPQITSKAQTLERCVCVCVFLVDVCRWGAWGGVDRGGDGCRTDRVDRSRKSS